jgi:hypothetical protein
MLTTVLVKGWWHTHWIHACTLLTWCDLCKCSPFPSVKAQLGCSFCWEAFLHQPKMGHGSGLAWCTAPEGIIHAASLGSRQTLLAWGNEAALEHALLTYPCGILPLTSLVALPIYIPSSNAGTVLYTLDLTQNVCLDKSPEGLRYTVAWDGSDQPVAVIFRKQVVLNL